MEKKNWLSYMRNAVDEKFMDLTFADMWFCTAVSLVSYALLGSAIPLLMLGAGAATFGLWLAGVGHKDAEAAPASGARRDTCTHGPAPKLSRRTLAPAFKATMDAGTVLPAAEPARNAGRQPVL